MNFYMKKFFLIVFISFFFLNIQSQNRRTTTATPAKTNESIEGKAKSGIDKSTNAKPIRKTRDSKPVKSFTIESDTNVYMGTTFLTPKGEAWKMSTVIEFGAAPSDADITTINVYGLLGLNFDIARKFHFGPYFRHKILSTHSYQVIKYREFDYDVASLKEWGAGLSIGGYFPIGRAVLIDPELRIGYNEFNLQTPQFTDTANNTIYRNFVNFTPRLNLGFRITNYAILNLHGGYTFAYYISNPEPIPHYTPSSFHYGLGVRFYLTK